MRFYATQRRAAFRGSYVGDGAATKAITGVGFRGDYVRITRIAAAGAAGSAVFENYRALGAISWHVLLPIKRDGGLTSVDTDGFTVNVADTITDSAGLNAVSTNDNGVTYLYLVVRNA